MSGGASQEEAGVTTNVLDDDLPTLPPEPRQDLVNTAVRFLQNPKVLGSDETNTKKFLEKKGLTKEEIDLAFKNTTLTQATKPVSYRQPVSDPTAIVPVTASSSGFWSKTRQNVSFIVLVGSAAYGIYAFIVKYVIPYFKGTQESTLESSLQTLSKIQGTLISIETLLKKNEEQIDAMSRVLTTQQRNGDALQKAHDNQSVQEIKGEISSLKGLLLNRRQFPPTPSQSPIIPLWQMPPAGQENTEHGDKVHEQSNEFSPPLNGTSLPGSPTKSDDTVVQVKGHEEDAANESPEQNGNRSEEVD